MATRPHVYRHARRDPRRRNLGRRISGEPARNLPQRHLVWHSRLCRRPRSRVVDRDHAPPPDAPPATDRPSHRCAGVLRHECFRQRQRSCRSRFDVRRHAQRQRGDRGPHPPLPGGHRLLSRRTRPHRDVPRRVSPSRHVERCHHRRRVAPGRRAAPCCARWRRGHRAEFWRGLRWHRRPRRRSVRRPPRPRR